MCLPNSENGPMKKSGCGMVAFHQALLVVGGKEIPLKNPQPLAQYQYTNEHHLHKLGTGEPTPVITCAVGACRMFVGGL